MFLALKARETPILAKRLAGITVVYALSPVDLIPEDVFAACREQAQGMWQDGRPKKWYYAIPIVAVWVFLVFCIGKAVF